MAEFAVTAVGTDRPGIVAAVARVLHDRGGNLEDSAMTALGGHFAIVLRVDTRDEPEQLRQALTDATAEFGLSIQVSRAEAAQPPPEPTHLLWVHGADRPGIVAAVAGAIDDAGGNITDFATQVVGDEEPGYAMVVEVVAQDGGRLTTAIERACADLGVDHTVRAIEADT